MTQRTTYNRPGAPANPPQHLFDEGTGITEGQPVPAAEEGTPRQTGVGTAPAERDVADPHPSDEEHPYRARHPGGAHPPEDDIGPNPARHDGNPPPKPDNADHGPKFSPG